MARSGSSSAKSTKAKPTHRPLAFVNSVDREKQKENGNTTRRKQVQTRTKSNPQQRQCRKKAASNTKVKGKDSKAKPKAKTQTPKCLKKPEFIQIVNKLSAVAIQVILTYVNAFLGKELHIQESETRKFILETLISSKQFERTLRSLQNKSCDLLVECFKNHPNDKQCMYKIKFTPHIGNLLSNKSSNEMKWLHTNCPNDPINDFSCVLHSIGRDLFEFIQEHFMNVCRVNRA